MTGIIYCLRDVRLLPFLVFVSYNLNCQATSYNTAVILVLYHIIMLVKKKIKNINVLILLFAIDILYLVHKGLILLSCPNTKCVGKKKPISHC